jgi:glutaredoxin
MNCTPKYFTFSLALSLLLCATAAHAQLYKWVGPDGKVTYSDSPPPSTIKKVETRTGGGGEASGPPLPFEVAEAARNHPVTLYTAPNCAACDEGRKLLVARGVPFSEKTVVTNEDIAKVKQLGESNLPLLLVGRNKQPGGFQPPAWGSALTVAGFPESSKLPPGYRNPAPEPAAPIAAPVAKKGNGEQVAKPAEELPTAVGNAPPGFRF